MEERMKALVRGLAAAALLLELAACADLGALDHVPVGLDAAAPRDPPAHSFVPGQPDAALAVVVAPLPMPALAAADDDAADGFSGPVSWYGRRFAGRRTANGEIFDPAKLTMAHRELPFGTRVRVTNPANGASVVVRVNDRGPFVGDRIADLSHAAARRLDMLRSGVIAAELEVLRDGEPPYPATVPAGSVDAGVDAEADTGADAAPPAGDAQPRIASRS
jgi:rare lipoprotein A